MDNNKDLQVKILTARIELLEKIVEDYENIQRQIEYRPQYMDEHITAIRNKAEADSELLPHVLKVENFLSVIKSSSKWRTIDVFIGNYQDNITNNKRFLKMIS